MDNYEPGLYTERMMEAIRLLSDRVMPNFGTKVEAASGTLSQEPPGAVDENEFIDATRLVYDGVREIRRAVLLNRGYGDDDVISISGIFEWGEHFTASKTALTAPALSAFALGLPGYVLIKVLQPGYFAREDTKTPMYIAGITVVTNIVFSLLLFWWLRPKGIGHVGIALATSIAAWVNVILLGIGLRRQGYIKLDRRLLDKFWRIGISSSMNQGNVPA